MVFSCRHIQPPGILHVTWVSQTSWIGKGDNTLHAHACFFVTHDKVVMLPDVFFVEFIYLNLVMVFVCFFLSIGFEIVLNKLSWG